MYGDENMNYDERCFLLLSIFVKMNAVGINPQTPTFVGGWIPTKAWLGNKNWGKNMSGSDSAGVNAMVPGRKCEPRTQLKPILFGFEPFRACQLPAFYWAGNMSRCGPLLIYQRVSSFFCCENRFFHFEALLEGQNNPTPVRFGRCIVGVMRVRDFSTATEVVMMSWDGVRKECGLLHRTPSLYKWNFLFSFGDPTCHSIRCLCSIVGRSRPGSRWRFCNPKWWCSATRSLRLSLGGLRKIKNIYWEVSRWPTLPLIDSYFPGKRLNHCMHIHI